MRECVGLNVRWIMMSGLSTGIGDMSVPHEVICNCYSKVTRIESATGTAVLSTLMLTAGWDLLWEKTTTLDLLAFRWRLAFLTQAAILSTSDWKWAYIEQCHQHNNNKVLSCDRGILSALPVASVASLRAMHTIAKGKTYTIQFCYKLQCHAETEHELHNHFTPDRSLYIGSTT